MDFPKRVYTEEEVKRARELVDKGHKHQLTIEGSLSFVQKTKRAVKLVEVAGYSDFLKTYIRSIVEVDGLTQLREADASIWANQYTIENAVDAASLFVQKANHMKEYIEGKLYYGGAAEKRSVEKRIEFLRTLRGKSQEKDIVTECERLLRFWAESSLVY